jgi:hypothetical protein
MGERPGGDQLVANIFVYLPVAQNDLPSQIGDQRVEQPMEADLAQAFGGRGRVPHIHVARGTRAGFG